MVSALQNMKCIYDSQQEKPQGSRYLGRPHILTGKQPHYRLGQALRVPGV